MDKVKHTNSLIKEKSPYLLQHAHNPVDWYAWGEEALRKAKTEDKLILVSIGYSACHWCHVMEHESFEDEAVAAVMNESFVCIKVDREERPDIDHVYMSAVQIMTGHGGWPLNCFALPDGRPVYGGTYFPKDAWVKLLYNLAELWRSNKEKAVEYASELARGLKQMEALVASEEKKDFSILTPERAIKKWKSNFDTVMGGSKRAPKFPMPNNWQYLLRYSHFTSDAEAREHAHTTLRCMAFGGIYDHVGGGFARYSTDMDWKVPHFEKMLYDNAQLISLYSEAFTESKNQLYRDVVFETIDFIERELTSKEGGFYSALDADSEGEEGKFYVWEEEELKAILAPHEFKLFSEVFSVNEDGYWEDGKYILLQAQPLVAIALKHGISEDELKEKVKNWKSELLKVRARRVRPGLDDKQLCSWNALMIKAYCDAYNAFGEKRFYDRAISSAEFFYKTFFKPGGGLFHASKNGESYINGFLDDFAITIDAFLSLFLLTSDENWYRAANELIRTCFNKFFHEESGMFYFTSSDDEKLVVRNAEVQDNVIPSSNSQMARNLYRVYRLDGNPRYRDVAELMLNNVSKELALYPSAYSNWSLLLLEILHPAHEVVIVGKNVDELLKTLRQHYLPNAIFAYSKSASQHPLFLNRFKDGETLVYVCRNHTCKLPVSTAEEALKQLN